MVRLLKDLSVDPEEESGPDNSLRPVRMGSELNGRRLKKFSESQAARRVAEYTSDFSPLRQLIAICRQEDVFQSGARTKGSPGVMRTARMETDKQL